MSGPIGKVVRDEQRRIMKDGILNFHKRYELSEMNSDELDVLANELLADSRRLRRPEKGDKDIHKKMYLAKLRNAQAKAVMAYHRKIKEIKL